MIAPGDVPALEQVQGPVDAVLERFLRQRIDDLGELDAALAPFSAELAAFVQAGGKRLRPAFVYWGHRATGAEHDEAVFGLAGAVELLHDFALVHDDVMDRSDERRGRPTVHRALAAAHQRDGLAGDDAWFGIGAAILAGDLAFVWADQLFDSVALEPAALARARQVFTRLRVEVMAGQYLDLRLANTPGASLDDALRVALLKSGRYTATRPLQLGAAAAGGGEALDAALQEFGDAVGVAFQLRDDVLGLFGDPRATGKGALDDLREGKCTVMMLATLGRVPDAERAELTSLLGRPDVDEGDADRVRELVVACGALDHVERLLRAQQERARQALAPVAAPASHALAELADLAAFRVL